MKLVQSWIFLVAVLKGDFGRKRDTEFVNGHELEEQWVCLTVS
jgi:hypothetical protein